MDRSVPTVIIIVVLLGVLTLMWRSWRARGRRDAGAGGGYPRPEPAAPELGVAHAFYVATTPRSRPLERLVVAGLGFRARATLTVTGDGVVLALAGEEPVFVPADAIDRLTRATWTIDRVVESDGLLLLGWRLNAPDGGQGAEVDSYFRFVDPADQERIVALARTIAPGADRPAGTTESEA